MKYLIVLIIPIFLFNSCKNSETENTEVNETQIIAAAKEIHERIITLDTHNDINIKNFTDSINYTQKLDNQVNLPKMKAIMA